MAFWDDPRTPALPSKRWAGFAFTPMGRQFSNAGKGPKNYVRGDTRIYEDVCERLTEHTDIDASEIEVKVENNEVTLEGTVADKRQKRLAEDVAASVKGVHDVHNRLKPITPASMLGSLSNSGVTAVF